MLHQLAQLAVIVTGCKQYHFRGQILVTTLLGLAVGHVKKATCGLPHLHITIEITHRGQLIHGHIQGGDHITTVSAGFFQQRAGRPTLLLHQRQHQVDRFNRAIALPHGQGLRV